jgi:hypothetical protein
MFENSFVLPIPLIENGNRTGRSQKKLWCFSDPVDYSFREETI